MKVQVSTYLDYLKADLDTQIEMFKSLKLDGAFLRKLGGKSLLQFTEEEINKIKSFYKKVDIVAVDPLIKSPHIDNKEALDKFKFDLELAANLAKDLGAINLVYRLPIFTDITKEKDIVLPIINEHLSIIRKKKLNVLIKQEKEHLSQTYRYVFENIKDSKVKFIFEPALLFQMGEAITAAFRILYDYIGVLVVDDKDPSGASRLIGTGKYLDLNDLFKRFVKKEYEGWVVLDSGLIEQINQASKSNWFEKTFFKQKRHENKILFDYQQKHQNTDMTYMIKIQLAVLFLVFQNKKIKIN